MPRHYDAAARGSADGIVPHAKRYVALGYPILPINAIKRPYTGHGLKDASTKLGIIARWLGHWPDANVGILPPAEVLVLDCDTAEAADQLEGDHPELQSVPQCRTPRGGAHYYLKLPPGAPHIPTRTAALPEVDIRGMGRAYLLAPPSRTERGAYRWERPLVAPDELPEAPRALLLRLMPKKRVARRPKKVPRVPLKGYRADHLDHLVAYARAALQNEHDVVASAQEGQRNDTLNRSAYALGQLIGAGILERSEAEDALMAAAGTCGLPNNEAERTIKSGLEAGIAEPRDLTSIEDSRRGARLCPRASTRARRRKRTLAEWA